MNRLHKYTALLEEAGVDGFLLTGQTNRLYAAGTDIAEGIAVVTGRESRYFTDSRYIEAAEKSLEGFRVILTDREHPMADLINEAAEELGLGVLGIEEAYLTLREYNEFSEKLQPTLKPCQDVLSGLRHVKEPEEIAIMKEAQRITDEAFTQILTVIREGMTEKELAAELIYRLYLLGAEGMAFDPIVVAGPNSSLPHGVPTDRRIQKGDFITMDFGARYQGYCADMTRTVALGYVTDEMRAVYETVAAAQRAGIAASRAGVTGKSVHEAAARVIEDAGYGPYFGHGYGHGLGIEVHEEPSCNIRWDKPIPVGACCSAEPGIYLPDRFGVRIEDVVIFTPEGTEDITKSPRELIIL